MGIAITWFCSYNPPDESLAIHKRAAAMKEKEPAKKSKSKEHA